MPKSFEYDSYSKHYRYISQFGSLWKERNLSGKIEYINKNGTYKETKATTYNYTQLTATPLKGLKIFKYIQFRNDDNRHQTEEFAARDFGLPVFLFTDYYITVGKELLSSVIEKDVIDGVSVSTTKTLAYNTNNILKSTHIVNSSGESVIDEIKYPFDDGYQSQTVYLKMMGLNMLNFPVKQTIKRNGKSNSISTAYMDFGTNFIKPSQILTQKDNNPEELRIQYHRYDSYGNPVYITKDNATKVVYIWGYKGLYPVAEIKNATYEEVQRALGGTAPESLSTNVTFNSSIDGLRTNSNLTNAQVSIYKYKPLVGLVSVTDPTGLTTNYTYDAFNRLIEVSFLEGTTKRVTESYNYNYRTN